MKTFIIHDKEAGNTYAVVAENEESAISKYEKFWQISEHDSPEAREEWISTLDIANVEFDDYEVGRIF